MTIHPDPLSMKMPLIVDVKPIQEYPAEDLGPEKAFV